MIEKARRRTVLGPIVFPANAQDQGAHEEGKRACPQAGTDTANRLPCTMATRQAFASPDLSLRLLPSGTARPS